MSRLPWADSSGTHEENGRARGKRREIEKRECRLFYIKKLPLADLYEPPSTERGCHHNSPQSHQQQQFQRRSCDLLLSLLTEPFCPSRSSFNLRLPSPQSCDSCLTGRLGRSGKLLDFVVLGPFYCLFFSSVCLPTKISKFDEKGSLICFCEEDSP